MGGASRLTFRPDEPGRVTLSKVSSKGMFLGTARLHEESGPGKRQLQLFGSVVEVGDGKDAVGNHCETKSLCSELSGFYHSLVIKQVWN